jgi:hypothetical protein
VRGGGRDDGWSRALWEGPGLALARCQQHGQTVECAADLCAAAQCVCMEGLELMYGSPGLPAPGLMSRAGEGGWFRRSARRMALVGAPGATLRNVTCGHGSQRNTDTQEATRHAQSLTAGSPAAVLLSQARAGSGSVRVGWCGSCACTKVHELAVPHKHSHTTRCIKRSVPSSPLLSRLSVVPRLHSISLRATSSINFPRSAA